MPLPEGYLPREGDTLILLGVVKYDVKPSEDTDAEDDLTVWVRLLEDYQDRRVKLRTVSGLYSRKWNEGDRVTCNNGSVGTVILATDEGFVWVKFKGPKPGTFHANDLQAAPPEPSREDVEAVAGIEPVKPPARAEPRTSGDAEETEF